MCFICTASPEELASIRFLMIENCPHVVTASAAMKRLRHLTIVNYPNFTSIYPPLTRLSCSQCPRLVVLPPSQHLESFTVCDITCRWVLPEFRTKAERIQRWFRDYLACKRARLQLPRRQA